MDHKNLLIGGVIFLFLLGGTSVVLSQEEEIALSPHNISVVKRGNELVEKRLEIRNNGKEEIVLQVSGIRGAVKTVLPSVDRVWARILPGKSDSFQVRGYISGDASPGIYQGEVILKSEKETYSIPIMIEVKEIVENISLSLKIETIRGEVEPGEILEVQYKVNNLGYKAVDVEFELRIIDWENNKTIAKKVITFPVATSLEEVIEIKIPPDAEEQNYLIQGKLWHTEEGVKKEKASDMSSVKVKRHLKSVFDPLLRQITPSRLIFFFFILLLLGLFYISYRYYQEEKWGKKRYLESVLKSIKFSSLPKGGKKSAFLGKVVGTDKKAFFDLEELQKHVMLVGSTGTGKSIAAQIIAEEALLRDIPVIVFDPAAKWTGFLRKNQDEEISKLYPKFGMKREQSRGFDGSIRIVRDPEMEKFDIEKYLQPGEITIFCLNKLNPTQVEPFIVNTLRKIHRKRLGESHELRALLVYEEIHRILPKFGGMGEGHSWLSQGVREFRRLGLGMLLISQVLSDFAGEIKANIGTEFQLMTKYDEDLKRIKLKYGEDIHRCAVKAAVGEAIIQNPEYNEGKPYIVRFRPPLHSPKRLEDEELEKYYQYQQKVDKVKEKLKEIKEAKVDVFDLEIELDIAQDNLKKGKFTMVDLYLDSINPRTDDLLQRVKSGEIKKEQMFVTSRWDEKKQEALENYEKDLQQKIERERKELEEKREKLEQKKEEKLEKEKEERERLEREEKDLAQEITGKKRKLDKKSHVLDLLDKYKKMREILDKDVVSKEWRKLKGQQKKLKELEEPKLEQIKEKREEKEEEIRKIMKQMRKEEEKIAQALQRVEKLWKRIKEDEKEIIEKDKEVSEKEKELIQKIKREIQREIEKRALLKREIEKEREKWDREKLKQEMEQRKQKFRKKRSQKKEKEREKRKGIEEKKSMLHQKLKKSKQKWLEILSKEEEMEKREKEIAEMEEELEEETKKREGKEKITKKEFNEFKKIADDLSEHLEPATLKEFSQSKDFQLYQKVMTEEKVGKDEKKKFILLVDRLLGKLSPKKVKEFVEDREKYSLYQKVIRWGEN